VIDAWLPAALFPIHQSQGSATDCPCDLLLQELEAEAVLPDVLAEDLRRDWIARMLPEISTLFATQPLQCQIAKGNASLFLCLVAEYEL
jgi:hypothetical protein